MLADLELKITGNVGGATTGIKAVNDGLKTTATTASQTQKSIFNLTEQLKTFQSEVFTEKDISKVKAYNVQIQDTQAQIKKLEKAGIDGAGSLAGGFTSLYGVVRKVAQILPGVGIGTIFGLALDPLLSYIEGLNLFTEKSVDAKRAAEGLVLTVKETQKAYDEINKSSSQEQAKVLELVTALQSKALSRQQEVAALKELKQLSPEYFGNLDIEKGKIDGLTAAYDRYKQSILSAIQNKLDDKQLTAIQEKLNSLDQTDAFNKRIVASNQERINELYRLGRADLARQLEIQNSIISGDGQRNALLAQQDAILKRMAANHFNGIIKAADFKEAKARGESIADILAKLQRELDLINKTEFDPFKKSVDAIEATIKKLIDVKKLTVDSPIIIRLETQIVDLGLAHISKDIQAEFKKEFADLQDGAIKIPVALQPQISSIPRDFFKEALDKVNNPLQIPEGTNVFSNNFNIEPKVKGLSTFVGDLNQIRSLQALLLSENVKFSKFDPYSTLVQNQQDFLRESAVFNDKVNKVFSDTVAEVGAAFGEGIGDALTGKVDDIFKGFFSSIFKTLGSGLIQLGEYAISVSTLIKSLEASFALDPGDAFVTGIALIALGSIIKSSVNSIPGFADGVTNFGGGLALVGERGPEYVRLPQGTDVYANYKQQSNIGGGMAMAVDLNGQFTILGNDLVYALNRTTARNSRNT